MDLSDRLSLCAIWSRPVDQQASRL